MDLRSLKKPVQRGLAWLLVWWWPAWKLAEVASTVGFMAKIIPEGLTAFLGDWGWAILIPVGILWLAKLEGDRAADRMRDRALADLPHKMVELVRRFEDFCKSYEGQGWVPEVTRLRLDFALALTLTTAAKALSPEDRRRFDGALYNFLLEYSVSIRPEDRSRIGKAIDPTNPIRTYLGRPLKQASRADPPSTTAPESPPPSSPASSE